MKKRAIELIRVSTESQAAEDRAGIPAQREVNRRTARIYGLELVRTISIVDVSGAAVMAAPEMMELLRLMESPEIHGVVTKEFSRLMRPEKLTDYALLQHFIDTQTVLYLPDGPIDFASKTGRFFGTIRAAMAGLERRELLERMNDAKEALRRAGKNAGGSTNLPFGVGYSKESGWFYTDDAEKVKEAFRLFLSGEDSYNEIARTLNLARTNVRFILENPIYTGWRVYDEKRDPSAAGYRSGSNGRQGYRRKMRRMAEDVIRVRVLDPLITEDEFAATQLKIDMKRSKHWRVRSETPQRYTYNGYLICGECGCLMYTHTSRQEFYNCKSRNTRERRIRARHGLSPCSNRYMLRGRLELIIDELLGRKVCQRDFLTAVLDACADRNEAHQQATGVDSAAVTTKLQALENKRQRVLDAFFEGVIGKDERNRRLAELDLDVQAYQTMLVNSVDPPTTDMDADTLLAVTEPFGEWEFLSRADRRALLAGLCPEISVYQYAVTGITLNVPTNSGCHEVSPSRTAQ